MPTLILSDLHIGACNCQHDALLDFFTHDIHHGIDRIILNGDTVDHLNFGAFRPLDWAVIRHLQKFAREDRLVLVQGNHDIPQFAEETCYSRQLLGDLLGTEMVREYRLSHRGKKYLVTHGDQFDQTLNMTTVGYLAEKVYRKIQRWHQPTSRWLKRSSKKILGVAGAVRDGALEYAQSLNVQGIILGHTHFAEHEVIEGLTYLNTGSWVDDQCHYIRIDGRGIGIHSFDPIEQRIAQPGRPAPAFAA